MAYGQVGKDSDLGFLAGPLFCKSTDIVEEETAHILFILLSVLKEGRVRQTLYLWIEINYKVQPELETRECPVLLLGRRPFPPMWEAVFADVGVAFIAILNATRCLRVEEFRK